MRGSSFWVTKRVCVGHLGYLYWSSQENCPWAAWCAVCFEASRPRLTFRTFCWPEGIRALEHEHGKARNLIFHVELLEVAKSSALFHNGIRKNTDWSADKYILSAFSLLTLEAWSLGLRLGGDMWLKKGGGLYLERYLGKWGFPGGSDDKESACNVEDVGLIPGLGRSPGEGNGNPLLYSCQENTMDRGAWWDTVLGLQRVRHGRATKQQGRWPVHLANGWPRCRVFGKFGGEEIGSPGERFQGVCVFMFTEVKWKE